MKIAALGSSFASGPGLKPYKNKQAARSERNYASLLANRIGAELSDLTSGGSTLLNIVETPQGSLPVQIDGLPTDADIITITSGGNDIGYVGRIFLYSAAANWLTWPLAWWFDKRIGNEKMDEAELVSRFKNVIAHVRRRAPGADIILVEYLTLIGPDYRPTTDGPLDHDKARTVQQRAAMLQRVFTKAADGEDRCWVLPVAENSLNHGVGSTEPWVTGHGWGLLYGGATPWHPNAMGMQAVAELLHAHLLDQGYLRQA